MARRQSLPTSDLEALLVRDYELNGRKSVRWARAAFRHLRALIQTVDVRTAYRATLEYASERLAAGAAPASVRNEIAVLGRALTIAARVGLIAERPMVARPRVLNARRGFVDREQLGRIRARLPQEISDASLFAFVSGWRRAEIFSLTWSRVDWSVGAVRLDPGTTKNLEGRAFPFGAHGELRRMFERRFLARAGPYVFGRPHGAPVADFRRSWKKACEAAGVVGIVFHDLRRSAVRNMERAGVPRSVAMQLTGHKTESIYKRYAITNEKDLARGVRLIARLQVGHHGPDRLGDGAHGLGGRSEGDPEETHAGTGEETLEEAPRRKG